MILVDSNVLMYAAGREHHHRDRCTLFLDRVASGRIVAAIDAETLQEILHRYQSINRMADGETIFQIARIIFPNILPITGEVMDGARNLMGRMPKLMARDAVHASVVQNYRMESICSFDRDFDSIKGLRRIEP